MHSEHRYQSTPATPMMTRIASARHSVRKRTRNMNEAGWKASSRAVLVCLAISVGTLSLFFVVSVSGNAGSSTSMTRGFRLRGTKNAQWVSPAALPFVSRHRSPYGLCLMLLLLCCCCSYSYLPLVWIPQWSSSSWSHIVLIHPFFCAEIFFTE